MKTITWTSTAKAKWPYYLMVAFTVHAVFQGIFVAWWLGLLMFLNSLLILLSVSIRVAISAKGVTVYYSQLPRPRKQIPIENIKHVEAIDIEPCEYGGWGYRGSMKACGSSAVVIRKGEGLKLQLHDTNTFVVTVDDAAKGAATLNELLVRQD